MASETTLYYFDGTKYVQTTQAAATADVAAATALTTTGAEGTTAVLATDVFTDLTNIKATLDSLITTLNQIKADLVGLHLKAS